MTAAVPDPPDETVLNTFEHDGYAIIRNALNPALLSPLLTAAEQLLASTITRGRDQGGDGKDGFRGVLDLDQTFLPLLDNPRTLPTLVRLLSPNIHLLSAHLIALPTGPPRTIRTPQRPGWHRDMYGVSDDLGLTQTPRLAIKVAHYLTPITPDCGLTMFLPGSHTLTSAPTIAPQAIDPDGARTPQLTSTDVVLFENRTWHASGINTSGSPRIALMLQYGFRWLQPVDDPSTLHADPCLTPIQQQLLGMPDRNEDGSLAKGRGAVPLRRWSGRR
ncbi:phytanoyl-CoA dioxygenase family protein [Streptomyces sp. NPDC051561]|uniref:phytanoyl-CoA dioxygenase family protein n=1 Tax=Streptomyces sp. NPDC051561 TaxID=3365658 RepID=UPI00379FF127